VSATSVSARATTAHSSPARNPVTKVFAVIAAFLCQSRCAVAGRCSPGMAHVCFRPPEKRPSSPWRSMTVKTIPRHRIWRQADGNPHEFSPTRIHRDTACDQIKRDAGIRVLSVLGAVAAVERRRTTRPPPPARGLAGRRNRLAGSSRWIYDLDAGVAGKVCDVEGEKVIAWTFIAATSRVSWVFLPSAPC